MMSTPDKYIAVRIYDDIRIAGLNSEGEHRVLWNNMQQKVNKGTQKATDEEAEEYLSREIQMTLVRLNQACRVDDSQFPPVRGYSPLARLPSHIWIKEDVEKLRQMVDAYIYLYQIRWSLKP